MLETILENENEENQSIDGDWLYDSGDEQKLALSRREKEASRTSSRSHLGHSSDPGGYLPMSGSAVYAFLQQDKIAVEFVYR